MRLFSESVLFILARVVGFWLPLFMPSLPVDVPVPEPPFIEPLPEPFIDPPEPFMEPLPLIEAESIDVVVPPLMPVPVLSVAISAVVSVFVVVVLVSLLHAVSEAASRAEMPRLKMVFIFCGFGFVRKSTQRFRSPSASPFADEPLVVRLSVVLLEFAPFPFG